MHVIVVRGRISPENIGGLCRKALPVLAAAAGDLVLCDVACLVADAAAVDALARLHLEAKRRGSTLRLLKADPLLLELVSLMGLSDELKSADL